MAYHGSGCMMIHATEMRLTIPVQYAREWTHGGAHYTRSGGDDVHPVMIVWYASSDCAMRYIHGKLLACEGTHWWGQLEACRM